MAEPNGQFVPRPQGEGWPKTDCQLPIQLEPMNLPHGFTAAVQVHHVSGPTQLPTSCALFYKHLHLLLEVILSSIAELPVTGSVTLRVGYRDVRLTGSLTAHTQECYFRLPEKLTRMMDTACVLALFPLAPCEIVTSVTCAPKSA